MYLLLFYPFTFHRWRALQDQSLPSSIAKNQEIHRLLESLNKSGPSKWISIEPETISKIFSWMPWRYFASALSVLPIYKTCLGLLYNHFFFSMAIKKLVNGAKYLKSVHVYCLLSVSVVANTSGFINKGSFNVFVFLVCLYVLSQSTIIFYFLFSQWFFAHHLVFMSILSLLE